MAHSATMCAHRTPFGPLPPAAPAVGDNLERVSVTRPVVNTLHGHLFPRPAPQLGLLFGQVRGDTLTLAVAMRAVWPTVKPHDPFDVDERLLLGASEALAFLSLGRLQWSGIWYMHADAQLAEPDRDVRLIRQAARRGLCDDRRVMVVAGWQDGTLGLRTSLGGSSSAMVELPTFFTGELSCRCLLQISPLVREPGPVDPAPDSIDRFFYVAHYELKSSDFTRSKTMNSSDYVKTTTLASSSRMAAPRAQRSGRASDVVEQGFERGFQTGSLRLIALFNMLARLTARRLMSVFEAWLLMHVTGVSKVLTRTIACVINRVPSFMSDRLALLSGSLDWRPQVLRPDVCSGVEPDLHLSF